MSKKENNQLTEIKINDLGRVTILAPHADDEWVGCNLAISKTLPIHGFHVFDDACLLTPQMLMIFEIRLRQHFACLNLRYGKTE